MSILERIKKLLRRYRGMLALGGLFLILLLSLTWGYNNFSTHPDQGNREENIEEAIDVMSSQPVELILETKYLCGTETEVKEFEHMQALEGWMQTQEEYDWEFVEKQDGSFRIIREVYDDLSPLCKKEGYFGISGDGKLTIFQGPPAENQVIESFFRLDTDLLDVRLPKTEINLLRRGIRVENVSEYLSILSTYGEFATEY